MLWFYFRSCNFDVYVVRPNVKQTNCIRCTIILNVQHEDFGCVVWLMVWCDASYTRKPTNTLWIILFVIWFTLSTTNLCVLVWCRRRWRGGQYDFTFWTQGVAHTHTQQQQSAFIVITLETRRQHYFIILAVLFITQCRLDSHICDARVCIK